jgi:hypothetical protein
MGLSLNMRKIVAGEAYRLLEQAAKVSLSGGTKKDIKQVRSKRSSLNRRANKLMQIAREQIVRDVESQVERYRNQLLFGTKKKIITKNKKGEQVIRTRFLVPSKLILSKRGELGFVPVAGKKE